MVDFPETAVVESANQESAKAPQQGNSKMYHSFIDDEGVEYGSFEAFYHCYSDDAMTNDEGEAYDDGYYWWACFPGCMPDGDPAGPFDTEREAIEDAQQS